MERHKKRILFCTLFNLFFEYSMRGVIELITRPLLLLVLTLIYVTLFIMLEDIITRFKFEEKHLILFAGFFGTIYVCVISSSAFVINPWFFGVNLGILLFVSIVWWGGYQTILPFYLSNRLFSRDWEHKLLSKKGWGFVIGLNIFGIFLISLSPATVFGTLIGYLTMIIIAMIFLLLLKRSLYKRNLQPLEILPADKEIKTLDILGIISFVLMGFCAFFLIYDPIQASSSRVNATAYVIITVWTVFIMLVEIFLIWIKKRKIMI